MAELEDNDDAAILSVRTGSDDSGSPLIKLVGDLDISSVDELRVAVEAATATTPQRLTFDLSGLRFMDSAGISVLLGAARDIPAVALLEPQAAVRRVIELTGLGQILEVRP